MVRHSAWSWCWLPLVTPGYPWLPLVTPLYVNGRLLSRFITSGRRSGHQHRASMYHPVGIVSPCHPERYTRRQVRKVTLVPSGHLTDVVCVGCVCVCLCVCVCVFVCMYTRCS